MKLNFGILGGGSWGTTVASLTAKNNNTILWARNENTVIEINEKHTNSKYLPGAHLNKNLKASTSIEDTVKNADVIVVGIPSQHFRDVLKDSKTTYKTMGANCKFSQRLGVRLLKCG